ASPAVNQAAAPTQGAAKSDTQAAPPAATDPMADLLKELKAETKPDEDSSPAATVPPAKPRAAAKPTRKETAVAPTPAPRPDQVLKLPSNPKPPGPPNPGAKPSLPTVKPAPTPFLPSSIVPIPAPQTLSEPVELFEPAAGPASTEQTGPSGAMGQVGRRG